MMISLQNNNILYKQPKKFLLHCLVTRDFVKDVLLFRAINQPPKSRGGIIKKTILISLSVFFSYFGNNHAIDVVKKKVQRQH